MRPDTGMVIRYVRSSLVRPGSSNDSRISPRCGDSVLVALSPQPHRPPRQNIKHNKVGIQRRARLVVERTGIHHSLTLSTSSQSRPRITRYIIPCANPTRITMATATNATREP